MFFSTAQTLQTNHIQQKSSPSSDQTGKKEQVLVQVGGGGPGIFDYRRKKDGGGI
jgi:hypothetical protein